MASPRTSSKHPWRPTSSRSTSSTGRRSVLSPVRSRHRKSPKTSLDAQPRRLVQILAVNPGEDARGIEPNASPDAGSLARPPTAGAVANTPHAAAEATPPGVYRIVAIPGDGVGPEVIRAGRSVLDATAMRFGFRIEWSEILMGGGAVEAYGAAIGRE